MSRTRSSSSETLSWGISHRAPRSPSTPLLDTNGTFGTGVGQSCMKRSSTTARSRSFVSRSLNRLLLCLPRKRPQQGRRSQRALDQDLQGHPVLGHPPDLLTADEQTERRRDLPAASRINLHFNSNFIFIIYFKTPQPPNFTRGRRTAEKQQKNKSIERQSQQASCSFFCPCLWEF